MFSSEGKLTHLLGNYTGEKDFKVLLKRKQSDTVLLEDITPSKTVKSCVTCVTQRDSSIYISANGDVMPCCYMGFYPKTYGHGQYHQAANAQLMPLITENNALDYSLEHSIGWFNGIERSWQQASYEQGRLIICDDNCGS